MSETVTEGAQVRKHRVVQATLLSDRDRTIVDRVVFGETPAHLIAEDPFGATLARRMGEDVVVRDYLATFAHTVEGARRVLGIALALARMTVEADATEDGRNPRSAAGLEVASWCALSLGRWELADALALRAQGAGAANPLSALIRETIAGQWMAELIGMQPEISVELIRRCAAKTLQELTAPQTLVITD